MSIGYVGLGNMGGALARRLLETHPLKVFDLNPDSVAQLVGLGATSADSLAALAADCDVLILCLPTTAHVRSALFNAGGICEGIKPGTLIIDQTSGDPVETRVIARDLESRGVTLVDAPVSGGAQGALAGTIAIMVGADDDGYACAEPILRAISTNLHRAGPIGSGQVIKLVNNMMSAATRLITYEGVALAAKNGIDPARACEILLSGGAKNSFMEKFMAPHVINGNLFSGFTLGLMYKDVRLACDLAAATGVPLFAGGLTREFYQMCINEMGAEAQVHTAALVVDRMSGTSVVPAAEPAA